MKKKLVFGGMGLYPEQITLETVAALRKCGTVYLTCIRKEQAGVLLSLFPKAELVSVIPFEVLILKVMGAFQRHDLVGVLDYGDPSFLCAFSGRLRQECARAGAGFMEYRAVSSLNALIADLGLGDLAPAGLYLATANNWEIPSKFIDPAVPLLLFSPDRESQRGDPQGLLAKVVTDIQRVYPPGHGVYFMTCQSASAGGKRTRKVKVSGLRKAISSLKFDSTIFIPGVEKKKGLIKKVVGKVGKLHGGA